MQQLLVMNEGNTSSRATIALQSNAFELIQDTERAGTIRFNVKLRSLISSSNDQDKALQKCTLLPRFVHTSAVGICSEEAKGLLPISDVTHASLHPCCMCKAAERNMESSFLNCLISFAVRSYGVSHTFTKATCTDITPIRE